jgi:hypothetical protein
MHEQCMKAYVHVSYTTSKVANPDLFPFRSFTISLRGGAFLQLLLVLSALAARFNSLTSELVNVLTKMLELSQHVLGTITVGIVL